MVGSLKKSCVVTSSITMLPPRVRRLLDGASDLSGAIREGAEVREGRAVPLGGDRADRPALGEADKDAIDREGDADRGDSFTEQCAEVDVLANVAGDQLREGADAIAAAVVAAEALGEGVQRLPRRLHLGGAVEVDAGVAVSAVKAGDREDQRLEGEDERSPRPEAEDTGEGEGEERSGRDDDQGDPLGRVGVARAPRISSLISVAAAVVEVSIIEKARWRPATVAAVCRGITGWLAKGPAIASQPSLCTWMLAIAASAALSSPAARSAEVISRS